MKKLLFALLFFFLVVSPISSQNNFTILEKVIADFNSDGISDKGIISQDTTALNPIFKVEIILINQFEEEKKIISNELKFINLHEENTRISLYETGYVDDSFFFSFKINEKVYSYHFYYSDEDFDMLAFTTFEVKEGKVYFKEGDLRKGKIIFREKDITTKTWTEKDKKVTFLKIPKLSTFAPFDNDWF